MSAKRKAYDVCAFDLLRQLRHRVLPIPVETRSDVYLTAVSRFEFSSKSDALHARRVERLSLPSLN